MSTFKKFSGTVTLDANIAPSQLLIECFKSIAEDQSHWIGATKVNPDGTFNLAFDNLNDDETFLLKIFNHEQLVFEKTYEISDAHVNIAIDTSRFDFNVKNDQMHKFHPDYIAVSGNIRLGDALIYVMPKTDVSDLVTISLCKIGFERNEAIASSFIRPNSDYEIRLPYRLLFAHADEYTFSNDINMLVELNVNGKVIARSQPFVAQQQKMTADIVVDIVNKHYFESEFTLLANRITSLSGISIDQINNEGEGVYTKFSENKDYLIAQSGLDATLVSTYIEAINLKNNSNPSSKTEKIPLQCAYALLKQGLSESTGLLTIDYVQFDSMLKEAILNHIIDERDLVEDFESIYSKLHEWKLRKQTSVYVSQKDTLRDIINIITKNESVTDIYLRENAIESDDTPVGFWNRMEQKLQEKEFNASFYVDLIKTGLQVIAITGIQKEMINYIMDFAREQSLSDFVLSKSISEWVSAIDHLNTTSGKLCVPESFLPEGEIDDEDQSALVVAYAESLYDNSHKIFFTENIKTSLLRYDVKKYLERIDLVNSFLSDFPDYDFRVDNIWHHEDKIETRGLETEDGKALHRDLQTIQNVTRVASGNALMVQALLAEGLKSSAQIVALDATEFVSSISNHLEKVNIDAIKHIYDKALKTDLYIKNMYTQLNPSNYTGTALLEVDKASIWRSTSNSATYSYPDLETLFGAMDFCACSECSSMYSPSAYFTDVMNFIKTKVGNSTAFATLDQRRSDLKFIDLSCKNANTLMPYIDLVNETLELQILRDIKAIDGANIEIPNAFQTQGTESQLSAYPEHIYKDSTGAYKQYNHYNVVYDTRLKQAVYPNTLPFDLPRVEANAFLKQAGYDKVELMEIFKPSNYNALSGAGINAYTHAVEVLSLPATAAEILTVSSTTANDIAKYYGKTNGIAVFDLLLDIQSILSTTNISYTELLQLLLTEYLNPDVTVVVANPALESDKRRFAIAAKNSFPADTCALDELMLVYRSPVSGSETADQAKTKFFARLHRFVRLYRATGWSIYQLDIVLRALDIKSSNSNDIVQQTIIDIAWLKTMSERFGTAPEKLCVIWSNIDLKTYIDFNKDQTALPSVYDTIFKNKDLINPLDPAFENLANIAGTIADNAATICAALQLKASDLAAFFDGDLNQTPVSYHDTLSEIIRKQFFVTHFANGSYALLAKQLIAFGFSLSTNVSLANTQNIINVLDKSAQSLLTWDEQAYMLMHQDENNEFISSDDEIVQFLSDIRTGLNEIIGDANPNAATINFDIDSLRQKVKMYLLNKYKTTFVVGEAYLENKLENDWEIGLSSNLIHLYNFAKNADVQLSIANGLDIAVFKNTYRLLSKITYLVNKLNLDAVSIGKIYEKYLLSDSILNLQESNVIHPAKLMAFNNFLAFVELRNYLKMNNTTAFNFVEAINDSANHSIWKSNILSYTKWNAQTLDFLVGDGISSNGILNYSYQLGPNTYANPEFLLRIAQIMDAVEAMDISVTDLYNALQANVSMLSAQAIRKSLKSQYEEAQWLKIVKPIQDGLRRQQRDALVDYILAIPAVLNRHTAPPPATPPPPPALKNENDLFAYLLIDVEMESCMKTSRLKMAISSAQLFMDRMLLNLEKNTSGSTITLSQDAIEQWQEWRKWYRIWEANRKIFLYPENWIEPELRDNKTKLFKELESHLLQDEVTEDLVENGFKLYLEGLNEVARLEPVSAYQQNAYGKNILHVFARTDSSPQRYYYRFKEDNEWSEWQKIDVDIKSDHISPVMWNNKLYIFWLTFQKSKGNITEQQANAYKTGTNANKYWANVLGSHGVVDADNDCFTNWKVTLNWTQLQNGKWQSQELCKDIMDLDVSKMQIDDEDKGSYIGQSASITLLNNRGATKVDELFKNRIYLYTPFESKTNTDEGLAFNLLFPGGLKEVGIGVHTFLWKGDNSRDPFVLRDSDRGCRVVAPMGTRLNKMKFIQDVNLLSTGLKVDTAVSSQIGHFYTYAYYTDYSHISYNRILENTHTVLNKTPSTYRLTASGAGEIANPMFNPLSKAFFFEDKHHTFLVEEGGSSSPNIKNLLIPNAVLKRESIMLSDVIVRAESTMAFSANMNANVATNPTVNNLPAMSKFQFKPFYHPQVPNLIAALNRGGVPALLTLNNQSQADSIQFYNTYNPTGLVSTAYPKGNMQFEMGDAYSMYNWEIFFHAPMMIAQGLTNNQQFAAAQKWYHYIFNPTSNSGNVNQRFWKFQPFHQYAGGSIQTLPQLLEAIHNNNAQAVAQVNKWEKDPFNPHLIARMRVLAYMKNVLMKYLDNLIAWADYLFKQDTMESINEATQLYILAANILGEKPKQIPPRTKRKDVSFNELAASGLDALSNAMVAIESFYAPNASSGVTQSASGTNSGGRKGEGSLPLQTFYFCLPNNDQLMKYWDKVADRLFKIRNCKNIDGLTRQLSLYESPIDPALLVRAKAMGLSAADVLNMQYGNTRPIHRFAYMVQKTNEVLNDVKALGGAMLSALEKKDAEALSLLRSTHEFDMLTKVKTIKELQIEEANKSLEQLTITKANTKLRFDYYASRTFTNANEQKHLDKMKSAMEAQVVQGILNTVAGVVSGIPQLAITGPSYGGLHLSNVLNAAGTAVGIKATVDSAKGSMAATKGGYERRMDDWQLQKATLAKELEQIEQQIFAAQIRLDITKQELRNHEMQMEQSLQVDAYMRSKFSNVELYNWMTGQLATTYFQSYQMAFDIAKQAQECFSYELPKGKFPVGGFIKFGYWDSLRKGLLSGENLQLDVRRMEKAYMESNERELELTKNISLAMFNPQSIVDLKQTGTCNISLPEVLFDMDYPGHYMRRIKSVSISIPCVAGPYTTINCQLQQMSSKYLKDPTDNAYTALGTGDLIATSSAQNDSGVFELNFRDERYLPFEGTGAVSDWTLSIPGKVRQFDLNSINDIIVHVKYTARDGGETMKDGLPFRTIVENNIDALFATIGSNHVLHQYISARHNYSAKWFDYGKKFGDNPYARLTLDMTQDQFPFFTKGKQISVKGMSIAVKSKTAMTNATANITYTASDGTYNTISIPLSPVPNSNGNNIAGSFFGNDLQSKPIVFQNNTKLVQIAFKDANGSSVNAVDKFDDVFVVLDYVLDANILVNAQDDELQENIPTSNLMAWWKADSKKNIISTFSTTDQLADESGNGTTLIQLNQIPTPAYRVNEKGSYLSFTNNGLVSINNINAITENKSSTVFYVGNTGFCSGLDDGQGSWWGLRNLANQTSFLFKEPDGDTANPLFHSSSADIKVIRTEKMPNDKTEVKILNKTQSTIAEETFSRYFIRSTSFIGLSLGFSGSYLDYYNGDFYEALIYDRALSDTEIKSVLSYLKTKYSFLN